MVHAMHVWNISRWRSLRISIIFFFITIFDHKVSFEPFLEEKLPLDALCIW